ncbi:MAG: response regulator, partial [Brevundimonas sp.]
MADLKPFKILISDDSSQMRDILTTMLRSAGAETIRETIDGADAYRALATFPADLALIDFNMVPLDGVAFTRLVRNSADSPNPFMPIIMMTGHAERRRVNEARDAGVNEFVVKPLTARSVMARLEAVILRPRP